MKHTKHHKFSVRDIVMTGMFCCIFSSHFAAGDSDAVRSTCDDPGIWDRTGRNHSRIRTGSHGGACLHIDWCSRGTGICKFSGWAAGDHKYCRRIYYRMAIYGGTLRDSDRFSEPKGKPGLSNSFFTFGTCNC